MTMPADRERDRRSLQDLAKMAQGTGLVPPPSSMNGRPESTVSGVLRASEPGRPGHAKGDDSGIIDLAMAAQSDPQAEQRAQSTPLAKHDLFDDEPASIRPGPLSSGGGAVSQQLQQPIPSVIPSSTDAPLSTPASSAVGGASAASSSLRAVAPPPATKKSGAVVGIVIGLVVAGSIAAGGFFYLKSRAEAEGARFAESAKTVTAPAAQAKPVEPVAVASPTPPPSEPVAAATTPSVDTKPAPKVVAKGGPAPAKPAANANAKEEAATLSQKDLPPTPAALEGDLGKAMGKAVGADGKPVEAKPAAGSSPEFAAGSVPQKPSQGAVTGAIGAVLPGARACLGPDDPVSRAAITFASAGTVQSVTVTGGAAGKPAEACIKSALGRAKVAPFAEPSYSAPITVRH